MIFSDLLIRLLCSECAIHFSIQNKVYSLPIINEIAEEEQECAINSHS